MARLIFETLHFEISSPLINPYCWFPTHNIAWLKPQITELKRPWPKNDMDELEKLRAENQQLKQKIS